MILPLSSRPLTSRFAALLSVLLIAFFAGMGAPSRADEIEPEPSSDLPDDVPATIQEHAWSSPIWYTPAAGKAK